MRTAFNAADSMSVLFLATLVPQCLGRPASALFGKGHKALPLAERRDSVMDMDRRDSLVDRRNSVISRRSSAAHDAIEGLDIPEFNVEIEELQAAVMAENQHQRLYPRGPEFERESLEHSEAVANIVRSLKYEAANLDARQDPSSSMGFVATSTLGVDSSTVLTSSSSVSTQSSTDTDTTTSSTSASPSSSSPSSSFSTSALSTSTSSTSIASTSIASTSTSLTSTTSTSSVAASTSAASSISSSSSIQTSSLSAVSSSSSAVSSSSAITLPATTATSTVYPSGATSLTSIIVPTVASTTIVGTALHSPAPSYVAYKAPAVPSLPASMLVPLIETGLQNNYPIYSGSGTLVVNSANIGNLKSLSTVPNYSRDQGKGGNVGGYNMFIYADTMSYTAGSGSQYGNFTGMVSNSVALDRGLGPASGKPVTLMDPVGAYTGSNGALRSFFPMTQGEQAYNLAMLNHGQRIAIWPESSIIPLNPTSGILYAPIVYINSTSSGTSFTYAGSTLVQITVPSVGGPVANRIAPLLFPGGSAEWGCVGGIRSYGSTGISGGKVYVLGNHAGGIMLGRTNATSIADPSSYQFWQKNGTWTSTMPPKSGYNNNFMNGSYSTVDFFYSPRHLTFMMVYQDIYADNEIYWRYLMAPKPIMPSYAGGQWADIVESITMYPWSNPKILVQTPTPAEYYTYGGGLHPGYFGQNDITNGGSQMLLSWTSPTGRAGGSPMTSYAAMHAVVTFK